MNEFLFEFVYDSRINLTLMFGCWLFAAATFANIFLSGQTHLLDKTGAEFFKHFPGLGNATAMIMVLSTNVAAALVAKSLIYVWSHA